MTVSLPSTMDVKTDGFCQKEVFFLTLKGVGELSDFFP